MMELSQHVLDERGMPDEWKTSVIVFIFKGKGDELWIIQRSETARTCHENCSKGTREANMNTS